MTRSRIIDRPFSIHQTAGKKRRVRRSYPAEIRPTLERLEVRTLLSIAGSSTEALWVAQFSGMPGDTRASQVADAQQLLKQEQNVEVVDSVGVPGVVILQTPQSTNLASLEAELVQVPGFQQVEPYDPDNPASSAIKFPLGPVFYDPNASAPSTASTPSTLASAASTPAPALSTTNALAAPATDPTSSVLAINGFDGMNSQVSNFTSWPDTTGAVGPSSYVEAVNTAVQIYNKDGTTLVPTAIASYFSTKLRRMRSSTSVERLAR